MKNFIKILTFLFVISSSPVVAQTLQWVSRIGGPSFDPAPNIPDEIINDIATDAQGNVYSCGRIRNNSNINGQPINNIGGNDILLTKFDCFGNLVWQRVAGNIDDGDNGNSLALDDQGHIYLTGKIYGGSSLYPITFFDSIIDSIPGVNGMFLAKLDTSGNFIWGKIGNAPSSGGTKLIIDSNENINVLFFSGPGEIFPGVNLVRGHYIGQFDTSGNVEKMILIDADYCDLNDFKIGSPNEFYIIGEFTIDSVEIGGLTLHRIGPPNKYNFFCVKLDSTGVAQWNIHFGSVIGSFTAGYGICLDPVGDLYITGGAYNGLILGADTLYNSLAPTSQNDFPFVAKVNPQGQVLWARNLHHTILGRSSGGIVVKGNGNVIITGFLLGQMIVGPDTLSSVLDAVLFVAEFHNNGIVLKGETVQSINGGSNTEARRTICDSNDNVIFSGAFNGSLDVNGSLVAFAGGYTDGFIIKWGNGLCSVGIDDDLGISRGEVRVYPNPAREYIHFRFVQNPTSKASIEVYDVMGKVVRSVNATLHTEEVTLDVRGLSPGIYSYSIRTSEMNYSGKFIVMD